MTTATQREHLRRQLAAAQHRADRAADQGDHAGHLIAASDARRILARMTAASEADYTERAIAEHTIATRGRNSIAAIVARRAIAR